ncbi:MAG: hypothetical protein H6728_13505 [Myxococcales bacterium]|nr:hypothetical protein [Myxococcales bacterium]MCB9644086.1 hypothetical protein [Myxococcales bacterium]
MVPLQTKGICRLCQKELAKSGVSRHLSKCLPTHAPPQAPNTPTQTLYLLKVEGADAPHYWMYLEVSAAATFRVLDSFFRALWLECCGHLSSFRFPKQQALSFLHDDFSYFEESKIMEMTLGQVLQPKMTFSYDYDFGSTTELKLQVVDVRQGIPLRTPLSLLARNEAPKILCEECQKKPATKICPVCSWSGEGWVCAGCQKKHSCGEDIWLPVVNSPRAGVCGYDGGKTEEQALAFVEKKFSSETSPKKSRPKKTEKKSPSKASQKHAQSKTKEPNRFSLRERVPYGPMGSLPVSMEELPRHFQALLQAYFGEDEEPLALTNEQKEILTKLPLLNETWIGGTYTAPFLVSEPYPTQPEVCLWTTQTAYPVLGTDLVLPEEAPQALLDLLVKVMESPGFVEAGRRSKILLAQKQYIAPFRELLEPYDITVKHGGQKVIRSIGEALDDFAEKTQHFPSYSEAGLDKDLVKAMFQAAATMYRKAPWTGMVETQPFYVDLSSWSLGRYSICVIGQAGISQGLLIFQSLEDHDRFYHLALIAERSGQTPDFTELRLLSLDFEDVETLPATHRQELTEQNWEIAGPQAYPDIKRTEKRGELAELRDEDVLIVLACAWGIAAYTHMYRQHVDRVNKKMADLQEGVWIEPLEAEVTIPMLPDRPPFLISFPHPERKP